MIHINKDAIIVMLPEGAEDPLIERGQLWYSLPTDDPDYAITGRITGFKTLPPSTGWQLKGLVPELEESEAKKFVEKIRVECTKIPSIKYKNYNKGLRYNYASESLQSLCLSHNMLPNQCYLLTK